MLSSLPQEQAVWPTCQLILQHACERLDPYHRSVAVLITLCAPPSKGNKVRSLRRVMGVGIASWGGSLENQSSFLGANTMPGQIVSSSHPITVQNYLDPRLAGHEGRAGIISSCTYPIMRADRIAGTFGATGSLPDYFSPARQTLIQEYAKLISIVFAPDMFYTLQDIELLTMPPPVVQLPYIETLQTRIRQMMTASMKNGEAMTYLQAEQLAWQQLEEELLQVALLKERKERRDGDSPYTR